jgi:NAD(P) transhydrogenase subunit alpha
MLIGVPLETAAGETRVAVTPETAKKLKAQGHVLRVQSGAGVAASATDEAYVAAGAEIVDRVAALGADLVLKVRAPLPDELSLMKPGAVLVGMLNPFDRDGLQKLADAKLTAFALEAAPRTTRAQSMDVLSSQANIAGYKAVMIAADKYQRLFPMLMTAAGTIKAARVVVLGVGVAGLQAIATAKRLGAVIEATDVRPSVKEQVESLGAKFIDVPTETPEEKEAAEGVGGYAKPMPPGVAGAPEGRGRQARRAGRRRRHHRADPGPRGAGAGHRGHGQVDEAGLGDRRHRRRPRRRPAPTATAR